MNLRDAAESDLSAIVEIYNSAIATRMATAQSEPVTVAERLPWFHEHTAEAHPLWVLELDGQVAGWLSFSAFIPRCAYHVTSELSVYVHADFWRRGIGAQLLGAAIAHAPSLGLQTLLGLIFGYNEASLRLFEKFGFKRWGHLPRVANLDGVERDLVIVGRHFA
ncbi:MAG: N-acetyltransferase family protein [Chthoniobacterales bacterium]